MSGIFGISINPAEYQGDFLQDLFWETFYLQHLGEDYTGLSTCNRGQFKIRTHRGLFRSTFSKDLEGLEGTEGTGYCGSAREPFLVDSKMGQFSICFSGNIINLSDLVGRFKDFGHSFARCGDDIEIVAKLLAQGNNMVDGIRKLAAEIKGAYSLLILTEEGIYAVCCPTGHWPLIIGEKNGAIVVASESGGFNNFGFRRLRDIEPGETVLLKNGRLEIKDKIVSDRIQGCSFIPVYTGFPCGTFRGIPISLIRKRLGSFLACRDIERGFIPDIVAPVPDSGRFHSVGYFQEFCRQIMEGKIKRMPFYDEVLLKFPYAGRSFTPQSQEERDLEAYIKILAGGETYNGLTLVIIDDSIVRGTQTSKNLVPKLESMGFSEIHFRISNPELYSRCPYGKTTKEGELFVAKIPSKEERIRFLSSKAKNKEIVKSLEYNTIEDFLSIFRDLGIPSENLCIDCDLAQTE